jgi:hypothetical protein
MTCFLHNLSGRFHRLFVFLRGMHTFGVSAGQSNWWTEDFVAELGTDAEEMTPVSGQPVLLGVEGEHPAAA